MRLLGTLVAVGLLSGCTGAGRHSPSEAGARALANVIADTCDAQIVFLGEEPSHGGGRTIEVRTDLVRELIQQCGFTHVAFESQIYDFVDLQERYATGTATPEALYDAIGGIWSRAAQIDPLVKLLHEKATAGQLTVSGIDSNAGGATAHYTQTLLAQRLGRDLPAPRKEFCFATLGRLMGWKFDAAHPKDSAFDAAALSCAREAEALASRDVDGDAVQYRLARNYRSYLEFENVDSRNERDRLMHENLQWNIARLPRGTRTIVWTATVHGLRRPRGGFESMASHVVRDGKDEIKSLAVIALEGSHLPGGRVTEIAMADSDSLEGRFGPGTNQELAYVDRQALRRAGVSKSRVLGYSQYFEEDWSELLDGVIVLSDEVPPTHVRSRKPLQADSAQP